MNKIKISEEEHKFRINMSVVYLCIFILVAAGLCYFVIKLSNRVDDSQQLNAPKTTDHTAPTYTEYVVPQNSEEAKKIQERTKAEKEIFEIAGLDYPFEEEGNPYNDPDRYTAAYDPLHDQVNRVLADRYEEYGLVDTNYQGLVEMIQTQVKDMRKFIDDTCLGWPTDIYGDDYMYVREYINQILGTFTGNSDLTIGRYGEPISRLQSEVLYCIMNNYQYKTGYSNHPILTKALMSWMKMGHIDIGEIISMVVEEEDTDFEEVFSSMTATVYTTTGVYNIYLIDQVNDTRGNFYQIIDIQLKED